MVNGAGFIPDDSEAKSIISNLSEWRAFEIKWKPMTSWDQKCSGDTKWDTNIKQIGAPHFTMVDLQYFDFMVMQ